MQIEKGGETEREKEIRERKRVERAKREVEFALERSFLIPIRHPSQSKVISFPNFQLD